MYEERLQERMMRLANYATQSETWVTPTFIRWTFITIILTLGEPDLLSVIVQFIGNTCK